MGLLLFLMVFSSLLEGEPVDLNTAGAWQLEALPGIGPVRAREIIDFREDFGPFLELDDLLDVPGIGPSTLEALEGLVCLSGTDEEALADTSHWLGQALDDTLLTVVFLDVGQGDAILLRAEEGQTWLIDGGPDEGGAVVPAVVTRLWEIGVDTIDVVLLSHPHEDHVGGLAEVIGRFRVGRLLDPGLEFYSPAYEALLRAALEQSVDYSIVDSGDVFEASSHVRIDAIRRDPATSGAYDVNELGVVLLVTCGDFSMLLTGDIGEETERHIFDDVGAVGVLKVPHHGSHSSAFEPFMRRLRPQYSVICVGRMNPFGHPHPGFVTMLEELGSVVLRTDRDGTIFLRTDGSGIQLTGSER